MQCSICNHEGRDLLGADGENEHAQTRTCIKNHGDDIAELKRRVEMLETGWMRGGVFVYPSAAAIDWRSMAKELAEIICEHSEFSISDAYEQIAAMARDIRKLAKESNQ